MKKYFFLLFLITVFEVDAQQVRIDESKAEVSFLFLDDDVDGTLGEFKFDGNFYLNELEDSSISGTVASETIDTDNWLRDRHLRRKYFNAADFPLIRFQSTIISETDDIYTVEGILTIKDIAKPTRFTFKRSPTSFHGKATINTSDFDINIHDERERNELEISIVLPYTMN